MENTNKQSGLISSIKFFIVSVSVTAAVWLWSIFSSQALQTNASKQTITTTGNTVQAPAAAAQNTQTLPSVNIQPNTNQPSVQVQPVTVNPSAPITTTGSSR